ncbi:TPA: hypothetical protein PTV74_003311 [Clostridium botulinum]|nr:hypothetical protein [Clostridium botulinum]HDK7206466.1 hypothetical protein [Clostridium botulinum]HDK7210201.1 hypothetical protein [Clostridium botulinum]HDK7265651.1 hypothetical protein [Clostridium botulinum]HDK7269498.1 hypothetical protein [Clostridium botulinum]
MNSKNFYSYIIYEDGTIKNSKTGRNIKYREHKGHYETRLTIKQGERKSFTMSRLLYWLFIEQFDYNNKNLCVSYKDGNKLNISLNNLYLTERKNLIQGEGHKAVTKLTDEQIKEIKKIYKGNEINSNQYTKKELSLKDLANKYGVTKKEIHHIIKGTARNPKKYKLK